MFDTRIRKNCKFYKSNLYTRGCTLLNEQICRNKRCVFYKNKNNRK